MIEEPKRKRDGYHYQPIFTELDSVDRQIAARTSYKLLGPYAINRNRNTITLYSVFAFITQIRDSLLYLSEGKSSSKRNANSFNEVWWTLETLCYDIEDWHFLIEIKKAIKDYSIWENPHYEKLCDVLDDCIFVFIGNEIFAQLDKLINFTIQAMYTYAEAPKHTKPYSPVEEACLFIKHHSPIEIWEFINYNAREHECFVVHEEVITTIMGRR